jgi:hypothetical protein
MYAFMLVLPSHGRSEVDCDSPSPIAAKSIRIRSPSAHAGALYKKTSLFAVGVITGTPASALEVTL